MFSSRNHCPTACSKARNSSRWPATVRSSPISYPWDHNVIMSHVMAMINAGNIGNLKEVHNWTNRPVWPQYANIPTTPPPVPAGLDWDLWLGPEAQRPYLRITPIWFFAAGTISEADRWRTWDTIAYGSYSKRCSWKDQPSSNPISAISAACTTRCPTKSTIIFPSPWPVRSVLNTRQMAQGPL